MDEDNIGVSGGVCPITQFLIFPYIPARRYITYMPGM
jgi:hypothetical protein